MTERVSPTNEIDRELIGEPLVVGERTLQPVAHLAGWSGAGGNRSGAGAGAWLKLVPVKVIVREGDDGGYDVPIVDETGEAIRGITMGALAVAALCWLLMLIIRWRAKAKRTKR